MRSTSMQQGKPVHPQKKPQRKRACFYVSNIGQLRTHMNEFLKAQVGVLRRLIACRETQTPVIREGLADSKFHMEIKEVAL